MSAQHSPVSLQPNNPFDDPQPRRRSREPPPLDPFSETPATNASTFFLNNDEILQFDPLRPSATTATTSTGATNSSDIELMSVSDQRTADRHTPTKASRYMPTITPGDPFIIASEPASAHSSSSAAIYSPLNEVTGPISMSPLTAVHTAAALTELAFLQSLLNPEFNRHDIHLMVGTRVQRLIRDDDAGRMRKLSTLALASRRLPAILFTVVLELGVGAVVGTFGQLLERHVILVSFMPMISAICGNIGLQASTSTLRSLATGYTSHTIWSSILQVLIREFSAGLAIGSMLFVGLSLLIMLWSSSFRTGIVCGLSIIFSSSAAGIMGTLAPIGFKMLGFDPALCAGPLETAVQDLIGISTYLLIAQLLLP